MLSGSARPRLAVRFLVVFALTVLLPGTLLAFAGVRALLQERETAERETDARLNRAADDAARTIDRELALWRSASAQLFNATLPDPSSLPPALGRAADQPGGAVVVSIEPARTRVWPAGGLLYALDEGRPTADDAPMPLLVDAETAELRHGNLAEAARLYRASLARASAATRPLLTQRLARTLRKSGNVREAERLYTALAREIGTVNGIPADLIARYEICSIHRERDALEPLRSCAADLYRDLVAGRWTVAGALYSHYSASTQTWLSEAAGGDAVARLRAIEGRKGALTRLAEQHAAEDAPLLTTSSEHIVMAWRDRAPDSTRRLVIVDRKALDESLSSHVVAGDLEPAVIVEVGTTDGAVLYRTPGAGGRGEAPASSHPRMVSRLSHPLTARAWLRNPAAWSAEVSRRQRFYLAVLGASLLVMVLGAYFTTRVVRQELAVAQLKSDFVSAVSHEFRSPLTGIRQLGELLSRGRVAEERRQEYYDRITYESDRLSRLVENLLDFSRMESGRRDYLMAPVDAGAWLRGVVDGFSDRRRQPAARICLQMKLPLPTVNADAEALAAAVENLLDNAIKYSPGQAAVWVDAESSGNALRIRVRDEGVGISAADQTHIFDAFRRGSGEETRRVAGAGIGLSLVRHVVSAHHGRVECESQLGRGTVFTITLPV
jgi:signal transduction histidine kinase